MTYQDDPIQTAGHVWQAELDREREAATSLVPDDAWHAATAAHADALDNPQPGKDIGRAALEAAAPLIIAADRQRLRGAECLAAGVSAIEDLLTMLGVNPDERPEHGGPSTAETLAAAVLRAVTS